MAKTDFKTIDDYQVAFPAAVQQRMQQIREIITELAPEAEEVISYQIPAFRQGKHFLMYYSAYKKHISLSSPWSSAFLQAFETSLKPFKVSKSAIQIPHDIPLPASLIRRIVQFRKQEIEA